MAPGDKGKVVQLRRTYHGEQEWFEVLEDVGPSALRRALIATGVTPRVAGNLVWFLEDQLLLDRHQGESSRNRYRAELAELDLDQVRKVAAKLAIPGQFNSPLAA
jgi:hypothetical protein